MRFTVTSFVLIAVWLPLGVVTAQMAPMGLDMADATEGTVGPWVPSGTPLGAVEALQIRAAGDAGTWYYPFCHASVRDGALTSPLTHVREAAQTALLRYPWLTTPNPIAVPNLPPFTQQYSQWVTLWSLVLQGPDAVKSYCQPLTLSPGSVAIAGSTRVWDADAPVWLLQQPGQTGSDIWKDVIYNPGSGSNSKSLDSVKFFYHACARQESEAAMKELARDVDLASWIALDIFEVSVQAVGMRSPGVVPTASETTTPGLPSLPPEMTLSTTSHVRMSVGPRIRHGQGGSGPLLGTPGESVLVPFDNPVGAVSAVISNGSASVTLTGAFHSIGYAAFELPASLASGAWQFQSFSNSFATSAAPSAPWTTLEVTPLGNPNGGLAPGGN